MASDMLPAKGHIAKIFPFSQTSVFLPLNEEEATWLRSSLVASMNRLEATGDFPEKPRYKALRDNLDTVLFAFTKLRNK
jgi:hypothetical protein